MTQIKGDTASCSHEGLPFQK